MAQYELRRPLKGPDGTILFDPNTGKRMSEKTGKVVWRARYRVDGGKEHVRHFPTKRAGEAWLNEATAAIVTGSWADPVAGRLSWSDWVKVWESGQVWTESTSATVETAMRSVPWGDKAMREIKPSEVQRWVADESKRGLAPATIKTRLNFVQMCFRAAVNEGVIPKNPATTAKAPRGRKKDVAMKLLTTEQLAASLEVAEHFRPFVAVCAFAGLRLGEAAGLQLSDIDLDANTIAVNRQVQGTSIPSTKIVPPKAGSERTVYVPQELSEMLRVHVEREGITRPDEHLFVTPLGRLYNRNNAGDEWRRIRTEAELPSDVTLHALRHTFASNLIAAGCDVVTVQRALGHSQPSITLNVYSHLWPSAEDKTRTATAVFMGEVLASADSQRTPDNKPQVS
ncbi:hypothetical protein GCM10022219_11480 [Microbacterium oryzae]